MNALPAVSGASMASCFGAVGLQSDRREHRRKPSHHGARQLGARLGAPAVGDEDVLDRPLLAK
jgi:hypothetical protein